MKAGEGTTSCPQLWASASDHFMLLPAAAMIVSASPAPPLSTWVAMMAVQTVVIWNMRRWVEQMPLLKKLLSTLPMILGTLIAVLVFPPQLAPTATGNTWLALGLALVVLTFAGANLRRSIDFIRNPEMIAFVVPGVNVRMARAESAYILLAPVAEELAFRHFPALVFSTPGPYFVFAVGAFVASHYINPWQAERISVTRILEQLAMAVALTLIYLSFGLLWAILAHFLYNLTARGFYVSYLVRRTQLA